MDGVISQSVISVYGEFILGKALTKKMILESFPESAAEIDERKKIFFFHLSTGWVADPQQHCDKLGNC